MKPYAGRHVEIRIRVMDAMDAPERRNDMEQTVLSVAREVQQDDRGHRLEPCRQRPRWKQPQP
jgi:hypothetical protein